MTLASPVARIAQVRVTTHAASQDDIDQLAAALRDTLAFELPADYLAILRTSRSRRLMGAARSGRC